MNCFLQKKKKQNISFEQFMDIISQYACHKKTQCCDWSEETRKEFYTIYKQKISNKSDLKQIAKTIGQTIYAQSTECALWGDTLKRRFV